MLVFNAASWETHVLNPAAAALLEFVTDTPRRLDEMASLLADLLVMEQRAAAHEHARTTVEQLQSLGLVVAEERP